MTFTVPHLNERDRQGLRDVYPSIDSARSELEAALLRVTEDVPELATAVATLPRKTARDDETARRRIREAVFEGSWSSYLAHLSEIGVHFARIGVEFVVWFELARAFREALLPKVLASFASDPAKLDSALLGMNLYVDIGMAAIGDAYLATKESIIGAQRASIRELSTPVLQVRPRLLIVPLIGVVDTYRARQLTEELLRSIRSRRAKAVVMDVTGVPLVDSKVASHLMQTVDAARLMGGTVILTGISPEIAQTLVTIGAELREIHTAGDLEEGIREAERLISGRHAQSAAARSTASSQD